MKKKTDPSLASNKKATHDYFVVEKYEAGIVLTGTEVKSVRQRKIQLKDSYVKIKNGEAFLEGVHISTYEQGNRFNHEPERTRKILLHKKEINTLAQEVKISGLSIVPLRVYLVGGLIKVEIALVKGKKNYDKREVEKQKSAKRDIDRELRERNK